MPSARIVWVFINCVKLQARTCTSKCKCLFELIQNLESNSNKLSKQMLRNNNNISTVGIELAALGWKGTITDSAYRYCKRFVELPHLNLFGNALELHKSGIELLAKDEVTAESWNESYLSAIARSSASTSCAKTCSSSTGGSGHTHTTGKPWEIIFSNTINSNSLDFTASGLCINRGMSRVPFRNLIKDNFIQVVNSFR